MQISASPVVRQNARNELDEQIADCNLLIMTQRAHPLVAARDPRPWLSRTSGEWPFPVSGEGVATLACCNPCGDLPYCAAHRRAVRRRPSTSASRYEADLLIWLDTRQ